MTAIKILSALAAGAFALSAAGVAQAQTPYSSYQTQTSGYGSIGASCRNIQQAAGGYVSAECATQGGYRWSTIRQADCRSELTQRDGVLVCTGATARTGPFYPEETSVGSSVTQPGGVIGALFGALFGTNFGSDQTSNDDFAQGRRPLNERRQALEARIDAGVRDGSLTRWEADRLRGDYDALVQLESRYQADGRLTAAEREDLRTRYRALSQQVGDDRNDDQGYNRWEPLASQRAAFDARLDLAVRDRRLTRAEATRLRADFQALAQVEAGYQRNGLDARETADLRARYAELERRIGDVAGGGYGDDHRERLADIQVRISAAERAGSLNRNELERVRTEHEDLSRLEAAYARDGLTADERDYLTRRIGELDARVRLTRR